MSQGEFKLNVAAVAAGMTRLCENHVLVFARITSGSPL